MSISDMSYAPSDILSKVRFLEKVPGRSPQYSNDILFVDRMKLSNDKLHCDKSAKTNKVLLYFGGDVQDLSSKMILHRDHKRYLKWSLEETALLLSQLYPSHCIMVIRPNRMERATFSCYDNFVESNFCGAPTHLTKTAMGDKNLPSCNALTQIYSLIHNLPESLGDIDAKDSKHSITLVGFSKGVVVLNQVLHDLHLLGSDYVKCETGEVKLSKFTEEIERIIWLDGGHNGGKETWITDETVLETIATKTNIIIEVKVTPYQVKDVMRPWIGKEEKRFRTILGTKFGLINSNRLIRKLYFEDEERNIDNHFKILTTLGCDKYAENDDHEKEPR